MTAVTAPQRIPRRVPVRPAPDERARHLRLVDADARTRERRRRWVVRLWATGIVVAAFVGVGVHALMAEGQLEVDRLDTSIAREQRAVEEARLAVAAASSPPMVVQRAKELGLVAGVPARVVDVAGSTDISSTARARRSPLAEWQAVKPNLESNP
jgi:hypothetical protein